MVCSNDSKKSPGAALSRFGTSPTAHFLPSSVGRITYNGAVEVLASDGARWYVRAHGGTVFVRAHPTGVVTVR
jgi:hypothetical protein